MPRPTARPERGRTLFRRDEGYIGTALLRDRAASRTSSVRFLTIDSWQSAEAFERFRERFAAEYAALDASCGRWTSSERHLGAFTEEALPEALAREQTTVTGLRLTSTPHSG